MAPLIALLATYVVARVALRGRPDGTLPGLPGRIALSVMLVVTGIAHFTGTDALVAMLPAVLPFRLLAVYITGVAELGFAIALLTRPGPMLGWLLVAFFAALLPANVYSALYQVGMGGHGPAYLWFRVPLQLLFIAWALVFTGRRLRRPTAARDPSGDGSPTWRPAR